MPQNWKKRLFFLDEEIKLLETLSDIISKSIDTKIAEEKLLKSEETYRVLFDNVQDVFFKTSIKTGEILDVSPSCSTFNGITREELIGQSMSIIYSDKDQMQYMFQKIRTEQKVIDHNNEITINGKLFYVSINATIIYSKKGEPEFAVGSIRDITERRLTEENLKLSEEKFRSIYESFEDIYFKKDLNGIILEASPSVQKHFEMSRESVIGKDCHDFYYDPADADKFYQTVLQEKQINDFEERFVNAKGEIIYFSVNAKLRYNSDGEPAFVEGTMRNVSERINNQKQLFEASEKIKESEEKFRSIYENMQDVYYLHEIDGKILEMSPSVEKHFKHKPEEAIGLYVKDFYNNLDEYAQHKEILLRDGAIHDKEAQFITANGELVYFSFNSKIIYDSSGLPFLIEGTMRNINERIKNQKQLFEAAEKIKESEEKFRSIYENFEDVYMKTTIDGIILDTSPSFERNFHIPGSDVVGKSIVDFYYDKKVREEIMNKLRTDGRVSDFDMQLFDVFGNVSYFSINAHFIYDDNGDPVTVESTMRNINERRLMQDEMLSKNRKLEFQNTELEQFAYIASHDLQEPLITVIHCSELLEEELTGKLDTEQREYLNFIRNSTSRMQLLVKGLLDYSRIGKERKTTKIDCNTIISDVISDMNSSINKSNAFIEYQNLPTIEANPTEMRQLFQNMISNAIKFRKKGNNPKVKITAVQDEENWVFSITDNGIGIKAEDIDKVFVIFKRLHNRSEYQGTGIGLSHCKKIIEQYHGKIWVESNFNEGSTFKWTLPLN